MEETRCRVEYMFVVCCCCMNGFFWIDSRTVGSVVMVGVVQGTSWEICVRCLVVDRCCFDVDLL